MNTSLGKCINSHVSKTVNLIVGIYEASKEENETEWIKGKLAGEYGVILEIVKGLTRA